MNVPIASTITLIMELLVAFLIFYLVFAGYVKNIFSRKLAFFAVGYEIVFNVGYMLYRTFGNPVASKLSAEMKLVGAIHGMLSLLILVAVVLFFVRAFKEYAKGVNSFASHKVQTFLFLFFWIVSLSSGILLYIKAYF